MREIGRLKETSTWPLLSRNANGLGLSSASCAESIPGSPKRLEVVPYTLGKSSRDPVTSDNP